MYVKWGGNVNKSKVYALFVFFALLLCLSTLRSAHGLETTIEVNPSTLEVDDSLPKTFKVNITVNNVENVWQWQVKLYFKTSVLQFVSADLPPGHIFDGQAIVTPGVDYDNTGNATGWGWVLWGTNLMTIEPPYNTFNGSGVMCRFTFNGTTVGTSKLEFARPGETFYTYVSDPDMNDIATEFVDGNVNVIDEFSDIALISVLMMATAAAVVMGKKMRLKK